MAINNSVISKVAKFGGGSAALASAGYGGYYLLTTGQKIQALSQSELNRQRYESGPRERLARKGQKFTSQLSTDKYDFYKDFNFPGDCVMKMFPGTEESPIFSWNFDKQTVSDFSEKSIFKDSSDANPPQLACYSYSDDLKKDQFRLELSVKKDNEGWVWMAGIKKDFVLVNKDEQDKNKKYEFKNKLWFREIYLTSNNKKIWKAQLAHEGEIPENGAYNIDIPYDWNAIGGSWSIDPDTGDPCIQCNTSQKVNKSFYWIPDKSSTKTLKQLNSNMDRQITRFAYDDTHKTYIDKGRTMIYQNNVWRPYNFKDQESNAKSLFKINDAWVANIKGNWRDLSDLCFDSYRYDKEKDAYEVFCK